MSDADTSPRPDATTIGRHGRAQFWRERRQRHPRVSLALAADARITCLHRGESPRFSSPVHTAAQLVRLAWVSDAFLALACYRMKARLQALRVPLLPRVAHRLAVVLAQVSIGDPVVVEPGVYIIHGQVVIDGLSEIGSGSILGPFVTVGLRAGTLEGPSVGRDVTIGTGAKLIGPVQVGDAATLGANAVVVDDVPAGATVVGAPARPL